MACKYKYKDKWYSEIEVKNQLLKDISLNDVIVELSSQMSYVIEINTAKENIQKGITDTNEEFDEIPPYEKNGKYYATDGIDEFEITKEQYDKFFESPLQNTQYYSNLTVPGGTNGSYREVNIESPLITLPKSHAQFNTEHTLMFSRMDDVQTYSEKDIEKLISLMENNGQLKIKCN